MSPVPGNFEAISIISSFVLSSSGKWPGLVSQYSMAASWVMCIGALWKHWMETHIKHLKRAGKTLNVPKFRASRALAKLNLNATTK